MESSASDDQNGLNTFLKIQVLLNAKLHNGIPNSGAVLGKVLHIRNELKSRALEIKSIIEGIVDEVSQLSLRQIADELTRLAPEVEMKHKKQVELKSSTRIIQKQELPPLKNAIKGNLIVRYAPDPSKYPHLGQGMNYLINRLYADKYKGKVILRFDDTNPAIVAIEYYEAIKNGLTWLNATWDEEIKASDFMEDYYEITRDWLNEGVFYVCKCKGEVMSRNRNEGVACKHRKQSVNTNVSQFDKMLQGNFQAGDAIIRLFGDLSSKNNVMRDPVMMRIVIDKHPLLDKFYPVFPTYDFASAFMEYKFGITHVIRSGEFGQMREELQSFLIKQLGGIVPVFKSFGRFNIQGSPTKGSLIRELVKNKTVTGWDDIRLLTLDALKKRGIHPYTARFLIEEAGLTPKNTVIAWKTVEAKSKALLEPEAKRFFFVEDPVELLVKDSPEKGYSLPMHPDHPEFGHRKFQIDGKFYIAKKDQVKLKENSKFRLKDLYNVEILEIKEHLVIGKYAGEKLISSFKIQWVTSDSVLGDLDVPHLLEKKKGEIDENSIINISGRFERSILDVKEYDVIQLERVGYAKLSIIKGKVRGHIVHTH